MQYHTSRFHMATLPKEGNEGDRGIYVEKFIDEKNGTLCATYEGSWLYTYRWTSDGFGRQITEPSSGTMVISSFIPPSCQIPGTGIVVENRTHTTCSKLPVLI